MRWQTTITTIATTEVTPVAIPAVMLVPRAQHITGVPATPGPTTAGKVAGAGPEPRGNQVGF